MFVFQLCLQIYTFLVCIFVVFCGSSIFLFRVLSSCFMDLFVLIIDCINVLCKIYFRSVPIKTICFKFLFIRLKSKLLFLFNVIICTFFLI
ncbi:hypothetical protein HanRHA438_Chr17g0792021 [Helianthus annuus]|nr:hypothetical protein HanIR_Chr17g0848591 [Helianthus annuus]KAJ0824401.1 hypothetical protein HanRHA438_Chr17g0792021 [Helianthus annuus]